MMVRGSTSYSPEEMLECSYYVHYRYIIVQHSYIDAENPLALDENARFGTWGSHSVAGCG